jgi:hypothetical protein
MKDNERHFIFMDEIDLDGGDFGWAPDSSGIPWESLSTGLEDDPQILPPSPEPPTRLELPVSGRVFVSQPTPVHSGCSSVIDFFRKIIQVPPTVTALISLRGLFTCTGRITRDQRRNKDAMAAAFEAHREEIFAAMEDSHTLQTVAHLLLKGNRRGPDREKMQFQALKFFSDL